MPRRDAVVEGGALPSSTTAAVGQMDCREGDEAVYKEVVRKSFSRYDSLPDLADVRDIGEGRCGKGGIVME